MTALPPPFDLRQACEACANAAALHREATRRGAAHLTAEDFDRLRRLDDDFVAALAACQLPEAIAADAAFHQVLLDAAGDPDLQVSVDLLGPRLRRMDLWLVTRRAFDGPPSTHPAVIAALEAGDADTAATLVEASFVAAAQRLGAALERAAR
jgi:DNA-binding GntR family transcriptional regulator